MSAAGMGRDVVRRRKLDGGRSVTFLATALLPGQPLRLWGVLASGGARGNTEGIELPEAAGSFIRLGLRGAHDGWSVTQLLAVARARFLAELVRTTAPAVEAILHGLERALAAHREPLDGEPVPPVTFDADPAGPASPYPWSMARAGRFSLVLCPDAAGQGAGVTPAQLLAALDLALSAWLPVTPWRRRCWETRHAVREVLALETARVAASAPASAPSRI